MKQQTIRMISWNAHYKKIAVDSAYVVDTIEQLGEFDVICLQEYVTGADDKLSDWLKKNNYQTTFMKFSELEGKCFGVLTAVSKRLHSNTTAIELRRNDPIKFRPFPNTRGLLETKIVHGDKAFSIMNVHLTYPRPHVLDMRKEEFKNLQKYLDNHTNNTWLLCGDFNFIGLDKRRRYLTTKFKSFTGSLIHKTWRHWGKYSPIRTNLDYLFWNKDINVTAKLEQFNTSDHRPIVATISLL